MDFVSDNNPVGVWRADRLIGAPTYVKDAPVLAPAEVEGLPSIAFADPMHRELPLHTKAATWLSAAYFFGADKRDAKIETALTKAAAGHGIADDVTKLRDTLVADTIKQAGAAPEPRFALWGDFGDNFPGGRHQAFYPINNAVETIASGVQLVKDASRMPVELFHTAAREIVKAAAEHGVSQHELHPRLLKVGAERLVNFDAAERHAALRRATVQDESGRELYADIVKAARQDDEANVGQYVELWADLDRTHGVRYRSGIVTPHEAFYSGMTQREFEKLAAAVVVVCDAVVPRDVFNTLPSEKIDLHFTKAAAAELKAVVSARAEPSEQISGRVAQFPREIQRELLGLLLQTAA